MKTFYSVLFSTVIKFSCLFAHFRRGQYVQYPRKKEEERGRPPSTIQQTTRKKKKEEDTILDRYIWFMGVQKKQMVFDET